MLEVTDVTVRYRVGGGVLRSPAVVHAVNGVSLSVASGESVGVVGESGCGKSSFARALAGLVPVSAGTIRVDDRELTGRRDLAAARLVQMVFQDPTASLNPRRRVGSVLAELLAAHHLASGAAAARRVGELLELVGLPASAAGRFPGEFSGGQRQRIGIARALAVEPRVLVADEAVSALDLTTQAVITELLDRLRRDLGLALVFISHDLGVVQAVCDRVAVMYLGMVVEHGPVSQLYADPQHPYTQALLRAVPRVDSPRAPGRSRLPGEPPSPLATPSGCVFHPRCVVAEDRCARQSPPLLRIGDRDVACHLVRPPAQAPSGTSGPSGRGEA
jgi:oligopeptide/dipeptide ABC transporter ATP-binding protein